MIIPNILDSINPELIINRQGWIAATFQVFYLPLNSDSELFRIIHHYEPLLPSGKINIDPAKLGFGRLVSTNTYLGSMSINSHYHYRFRLVVVNHDHHSHSHSHYQDYSLSSSLSPSFSSSPMDYLCWLTTINHHSVPTADPLGIPTCRPSAACRSARGSPLGPAIGPWRPGEVPGFGEKPEFMGTNWWVSGGKWWV